MPSTLVRVFRAARFRWELLIVIATLLSACLGEPDHPAELTGTTASQSAPHLPIVDTSAWLVGVPNPPASWRQVVSRRDDVIRHRFVRFRRPETLPDPASRFVVRPFADTRLTLRMRRAGPVGEFAYSWFGMLEDDPRGYAGIAVRPNGRVAVEIQTPTGVALSSRERGAGWLRDSRARTAA